jgi:hypothetical protein
MTECCIMCCGSGGWIGRVKTITANLTGAELLACMGWVKCEHCMGTGVEPGKI